MLPMTGYDNTHYSDILDKYVYLRNTCKETCESYAAKRYTTTACCFPKNRNCVYSLTELIYNADLLHTPFCSGLSHLQSRLSERSEHGRRHLFMDLVSFFHFSLLSNQVNILTRQSDLSFFLNAWYYPSNC